MQDFNLLAQRYKTPNIVTGNIIHVSICPSIISWSHSIRYIEKFDFSIGQNNEH